MAISVRLGADIFKTYKEAMTKGKVEITGQGTSMELTAENFKPTIDALSTLHAKIMKVKSKGSSHMERLWALQECITKVNAMAIYFVTANNDEVDETEGKSAA
jgi:hypothetical protein